MGAIKKSGRFKLKTRVSVLILVFDFNSIRSASRSSTSILEISEHSCIRVAKTQPTRKPFPICLSCPGSERTPLRLPSQGLDIPPGCWQYCKSGRGDLIDE